MIDSGAQDTLFQFTLNLLKLFMLRLYIGRLGLAQLESLLRLECLSQPAARFKTEQLKKACKPDRVIDTKRGFIVRLYITTVPIRP